MQKRYLIFSVVFSVVKKGLNKGYGTARISHTCGVFCPSFFIHPLISASHETFMSCKMLPLNEMRGIRCNP